MKGYGVASLEREIIVFYEFEIKTRREEGERIRRPLSLSPVSSEVRESERIRVTAHSGVMVMTARKGDAA